jgi:hypothetical protein
MPGLIQAVTLDGVTLTPYRAGNHKSGSVSRAGYCGQGGKDTCHRHPLFSVSNTSGSWSIAACEVHIYGALHDCRTHHIKAMEVAR